MNLTVRDIRPEDIEQTTRLYHVTWLDTYPNEKFGITREDIDKSYENAYAPEVQEKRRERVRNLPDTERYIVAEDNGKIVGVCRVHLRKDHNYLQTIYVLPEYQGRGIGQALWTEIRSFFDPTLKTVLEVVSYNTKAIQFYKKQGFTETGKEFTEERFRMPSGALLPETQLVKPPEK